MKKYLLLVLFILIFLAGKSGIDIEVLDKGVVHIKDTKTFNIDYPMTSGKKGGELIINFDKYPNTFNPFFASDIYEKMITNQLFDSLVSYNFQTKIYKNELAKDYKIIVDESKGSIDDITDKKTGLMQVYVYLKDNIFWSNGEKITSRDIVNSYNLAIETGNSNIYKNLLYYNINNEYVAISVEEGKNNSVIFTIPRVIAEPLAILSEIKIVPVSNINQTKSDDMSFYNLWLYENLKNNTHNIVSSGSFVLERINNDSIILKPNKYYYKKDSNGKSLPYLNEINIVYNNTEADIVVLNSENFFDYYSNNNYDVWSGGLSNTYNFMSFNHNPKSSNYKYYFSEKDFKKAISLIIDRKEILKKVYNKIGTYSFYPFPIKGYDFPIELNKDLEKALELFVKMGFNKKNGKWYDGNNELVNFKIVTNLEDETRIRIINLVAKQLSNFGIEVNTEYISYNSLVQRIYQNSNWDCIYTGLNQYKYFKQVEQLFNYLSDMHFWNISKNENPDYIWDKLLYDKIYSLVYSSKITKKAIIDFYQTLNKNYIFIPIVQGIDNIAIKKNKFSNFQYLDFETMNIDIVYKY